MKRKINCKRACRVTIVALGILLTAASPVLANPTPISSPGSSVAPFALKPVKGISIAEETLTIQDGKIDTIPSPIMGGGRMNVPCVRYHAQYHFENKTGKPQSIKLGFPVIVYSTVAGGSFGGLESLKAVYGNSELVVKELSESRPKVFPLSELSEIKKELRSAGVIEKVAESPDFADLTKLGESLKTAKAALIESKTLTGKQVNHCLTVLKRLVFANGESDETLTQQRLIWYTFEVSLPPGLSDELAVSYNSFVPFGDDYSFSYILSTAQFWNNQTQKLNIEIEPDSKFLKQGGRYEILPNGKFARSNKSGRFTFRSLNKAPNFDIHVKRIPST